MGEKIDHLNLMKSHHRQCTASTLMYGNHKYMPRTEHQKPYHRLATSFQAAVSKQHAENRIKRMEQKNVIR